MPTKRVLLAALAVTLLVVAGCTSPAEDEESSPEPTSESPGEPETSETPEVVPAETVRLDLAPGIAQPGKRPEKSRDHVATVTVEPASPGGRVVLQRRGGGGWQTVSRAKQDDDGVATYTVAPPDGAGSQAYRAMVVNPDGERVRSKQAATSWATSFRDEFDGNALDSAKWSHRQLGLYNPDGSRACSKSDRSAVSVGGGTVELQVRLDPARRGERCETDDYGTFDYYLNGHISTEDKYAFTHGIAAARVKMQQGRGQHAAFWLQRTQDAPYLPGQPAATGAEIDIVEFFGEGYPKGGLASFLFYLNASGENEKVGGLVPKAEKQLPPGDTWWKQYHVFSVEWTPDRYVFRVDGRDIYRSNEGVSGVDEFLILSLLSSDWELGRIKNKTLPSSMKVDWVRVWQRQ